MPAFAAPSLRLVAGILVAGAVGGTLDLAFALSFAAYGGVGPIRLLQIVASGALGPAAHAGGAATAALGLALHFLLSCAWAAGYFAIAVRVPRVTDRPIASGIAFGVLVFLAMRLIVLPLSAYPGPIAFASFGTFLDLLSHALLFGVPIAATAAATLRRSASATDTPSAGDEAGR